MKCSGRMWKPAQVPERWGVSHCRDVWKLRGAERYSWVWVLDVLRGGQCSSWTMRNMGKLLSR